MKLTKTLPLSIATGAGLLMLVAPWASRCDRRPALRGGSGGGRGGGGGRGATAMDYSR